MITINKKPNGWYAISSNGEVVGEVNARIGSNVSKKNRFSLNLHGIFWAYDFPNKTHGTTCRSFSTLKEALHVADALTNIPTLTTFYSDLVAAGKVDFNAQLEKYESQVVKEVKVKEPSEVTSGSRWTAEEDESLLDEFSKKLSILDITKKHNRTIGGIISRLQRLGVVDKDYLTQKKLSEQAKHPI